MKPSLNWCNTCSHFGEAGDRRCIRWEVCESDVVEEDDGAVFEVEPTEYLATASEPGYDAPDSQGLCDGDDQE